MTEEKTPEQRVQELQSAMASDAAGGVNSMSVDGVQVSKQSNADRKIAIDEAKKAAVEKLPIRFLGWR